MRFPFRRKVRCDSPEPFVCVCGAEYKPATFRALDVDGKVVEMTALSCPTDGCGGNIAQRCEWRVAEMEVRNHGACQSSDAGF
jgi:hypothetical protein